MLDVPAEESCPMDTNVYSYNPESFSDGLGLRCATAVAARNSKIVNRTRFVPAFDTLHLAYRGTATGGMPVFVQRRCCKHCAEAAR